jgi:WD40 repeat protein
MGCIFCKTGPGQNLLPTIKEADYADNLFIGCDQRLIQLSVSQGKKIKDYGDIMTGHIQSMV